MIGYLQGTIHHFFQDAVIVLVQGIGYHVAIDTRTLHHLKSHPDSIASLWIETFIRDDRLNLFGFLELAEQEWFRFLTTVPGVGVKMALNILSQFTPCELQSIILQDQQKSLCVADGVGPKLATRITRELKEKAEKWGNNFKTISCPSFSPSPSSIHELEAFSALRQLGYCEKDIISVFSKINEKKEVLNTESLIRKSLQYLSKL